MKQKQEISAFPEEAGVAHLDIDVGGGLSAYRTPEYRTLHGLAPGTTHEEHTDWLARLFPEDRERADRLLREALAGPSTRYASEYRIVRPCDGEVRWISARARIQRDADGTPVRLLGAHVDVTSLKNSELNKDRFLATLAHELRNPLATILTAVELHKRAANRPELDDMMRRNVERMARLVDDLLEASQIGQGDISLKPEPCDLKAIVLEVVREVDLTARAQGLNISVAIPAKTFPVTGDRVRLAQIVTNLLGNAVRYTDRGGRIMVKGWQEDGMASIAIEDTGIGIEADKLACIFGMFTQVDPSDPRSKNGLGVGLALALRLARMHKGDIRVHSDGKGRGSTFTFTMPAGQAASRRLAPGPRAAAPREPLRVLVIDDEVDGADSLDIALRSLGHETRVAYGAQEALKLLAEWVPHAIILDVGMPVMDGYALARAVREKPALSAVVLIALSGWTRDGDKAKARAAGMAYHLTKPVTLDALGGVLAQVGQKRRQG